MKTEQMRRYAKDTIESVSRIEGIPECGMAPVIEAERNLEIADIAEKMSGEEWERIHSVPTYSSDMRSCKDIKEKYGLSWSELKALRAVER